MAIELEMPELAESVVEGEIVKWLVKEGDRVEQDQLLVEVMTDKVTVEVPSPYAGVLLKQVAKEGEVVAIGKPIAMAWDARGRLWVAECYTYAENPDRWNMSLRDRIVIFEDKTPVRDEVRGARPRHPGAAPPPDGRAGPGPRAQGARDGQARGLDQERGREGGAVGRCRLEPRAGEVARTR